MPWHECDEGKSREPREGAERERAVGTAMAHQGLREIENLGAAGSRLRE